MNRAPDEEADLELVKELVFARRDLVLERFSHAETMAGRTPDFRVLRNGKLVAFSEVKSPRDDWLDNQIDLVPPGRIVGGERSDPTFNRIARHVEKGASQFDAVNAGRVVPNILVFVNHADGTDLNDLRETLTGMFHSTTGKRIPTVSHISENRIGDAKSKIDLCIWIDRKTRRFQGYLVNIFSPQHLEGVCDLFALDSNSIRP